MKFVLIIYLVQKMLIYSSINMDKARQVLFMTDQDSVYSRTMELLGVLVMNSKINVAWKTIPILILLHY